MEKSQFSSDGRISRKTYWTRWAAVVGATYGLAFLGGAADSGAITALAGIVNLIGSLYLIIQGVKRMHDTDHSGWFILIPCYNLILFCTKGTPGPNRFGNDPLGGGVDYSSVQKTFE